MQHSSLNARLIASVVDIFIIMIIIAPFNSLIIHLFSGANTEEIAQAYIESHSGNGISFTDFIQHLSSQNAIAPYLISQITSLLIAAFYLIGFWAYKGATPGKMLLRIKIVDNITGEKITLKQSIQRFFGYILSTLLLCIGFIMMHFRKDSRGLHDIIASTAVIEENIISDKKK
jgi:uncharacterized RDD family membrane protein YckC